MQAYHTLLPVGRYPLAVIFVEIDPAQVDVNVHPQKTQVRFVDERRVFAAVQKAVRRAVVEVAPVPDFGLGADGRLESAAGASPNVSPTAAAAWSARRAAIVKAGRQHTSGSVRTVRRYSGRAPPCRQHWNPSSDRRQTRLPWRRP